MPAVCKFGLSGQGGFFNIRVDHQAREPKEIGEEFVVVAGRSG